MFDKKNLDQRMIYYADKVAMTGQEMALVQRLEQDKASLNLPVWWRTGDTLRFGHVVKLDINKTKQVPSFL